MPRFCFHVLPSILNRLYSQPSLSFPSASLLPIHLPPQHGWSSHLGRHKRDGSLHVPPRSPRLRDSRIHGNLCSIPQATAKHISQNWPGFPQAGGPRSTAHAHLNAQKGTSHKNPIWCPSHGKTQFLCDCVERQPDSTLAELQTELREICGVEVSIQTITRSLQREGYTMKTVRHSFYWIVTLTITSIS